MVPETEIFIDIVTQRLVEGLKSNAEFRWNKFFQGSVYPLRVYPVKPATGVLPVLFGLVPLASLSLEIYIGGRAGSENLLVSSTDWEPSPDGYFSGELNLNTAALNTVMNALASDVTYPTYMEWVLKFNGAPRPVAQFQIEIIPVVKDPDSEDPEDVTGPVFITRQDLKNLALLKDNPAGIVGVFRSPNGLHTRVIGIDDDGNFIDTNL